MDKVYRPRLFDSDPAAPGAEGRWLHWFRAFTHYMSVLGEDANPLAALVNHVSPEVYAFFAESATYEEAIGKLQARFVKRKNEMYARHLLATRRQEAGESLDQFEHALTQLSKDCDFRAVSAEDHRDEATREALIQGLRSAPVRQRLLETAQPSFAAAMDTASALTMAHQQSETYGSPMMTMHAAAVAAQMDAAAAAAPPGPPRGVPDTAGETEGPDTSTTTTRPSPRWANATSADT